MTELTSDEPILTILSSLQRRRGFLGLKVETYNVIITPQRLVFAAVSSGLMKEAVAEAREEAKRQGAGFMGQWGAQFGWLGILDERYRQMPVEAILAQYAGSFAVPSAEVRRVTTHSSEDDESGRETHEVQFDTTSGKHRFQLVNRTAAEARELLSQYLPGVVR